MTETRPAKFPLSPLQQGMLFHALSASSTGVDIEQLVCQLQLPFDRTRFEDAWGQVVARHEILRTRFVTRSSGPPLQEVLPFSDDTRIPIVVSNSGLSDSKARGEEVNAYVAADRLNDFDLSDAPQQRLRVFVYDDATFSFVWTFHHILLDGRSFPIVLDEFLEAYETGDVERPLPAPFSDYIAFREQHAAKVDETFWREQLASFRAPTQLSVLADSAPDAVFIPGACELRLSNDLTAACRDLAKRNAVTLNTVVQSAFALLLCRYSGEETVLFGNTRACRRGSAEGAEDMVGMLINTVPFVAHVDEARSIKDLLSDVRALHVQLRDHEHVALSDLHPLTQIPRQAPLFETFMVYEHSTLSSQLKARSERFAKHSFRYLGQTNFPFALLCYGESEMLLRLEYDGARLSEAAAERALGHLQTIFASLCHSKTKTIGDVELLSLSERRTLLEVWNNTSHAYDAELAVHHAVERIAEQTPERSALVFEGKTMSYAELNAAANVVAQQLIARGAKRDQLIGVCVERGFDMVVAVLGVMKSGAAYVPLDPHHPKDRLAIIAEDAGFRLVLTNHATKGAVPQGSDGTAFELLLVDEVSARPGDHASSENPSLPVDPEQLVYAIFTSGSTGRPKGVEIPQRALANFLSSMARHPGFSESDRLLAVTTLSFDIAALELYLPLMQGGVVEIASEEMAMDAYSLRERLESGEITVFQATPATYQMLLEAGTGALPSLTALCGGEALPKNLAQAFAHRCKAFVNMYGPTETTIWSSTKVISESDEQVLIGRPIDNTALVVATKSGRLQPARATGELWILGDGLAQGYRNRPEQTRDRFVSCKLAEGQSARAYRTGDLARFTEDGEVECLGRIDFQVKVRGFRIELGEIETVLSSHPSVSEAVVVVRGEQDNRHLVGHLRLQDAPPDSEQASRDIGALIDEIREYTASKLPPYMLPSSLGVLDAFPLTPNGKIDRKALPDLEAQPTKARRDAVGPQPGSDYEARLAQIFEQVLGVQHPNVDENFFDLGGNSMLLVRVVSAVQEWLGERVPGVKLFQYPTIRGFARYLEERTGTPSAAVSSHKVISDAATQDEAVAVVGFALRVPGARTPEEFRSNLERGVESIRAFGIDELDPSLDPDLVAKPNYVRARGVIPDLFDFDAGYFGMNPREAQLTDPQHRLFLKLAVEALERAGCDPDRFEGRVGVYGGMGNNLYFPLHLRHRPDLVQAFGEFQTMLANEKDYLATRVAYKLDLRGPAVNVQTACSTGLVAICEAALALRRGACDLALAGAVSAFLPQHSGSLFQAGGIASEDGHCRPFDARATGTVFSSGAGLVALKRLSDAERDGNHIHAVLLGVGLNNDGAAKVSFMAPSVEGQATAIAAAYEDAGVHPDTVGYVEAHGTATPMGDPIEFEGLRLGREQARARISTGSQRNARCRIGSVKSNIGHLDTAAGTIGFIKAALSLESRKLYKTLHFEEINPGIELGDEYCVQAQTESWPEANRRAGVSSFGVGGTNAHVLLQEPPSKATGTSSPPPTHRSQTSPSPLGQVFFLSGRTKRDLDAQCAQFANFLETTERSASDVAHTLLTGRRRFSYRRVVVGRDCPEAAEALRSNDITRTANVQQSGTRRELAYLFPGQGSQYVNMGKPLYEDFATFRDCVDRVSGAVGPIEHDRSDHTLREVLYPAPGFEQKAATLISETKFTQPIMFAVELAFARLLSDFGIEPDVVCGHSIGEYVAACLASVFEEQDAARLVALRGQLIQALPGGHMLSVRANADDIAADLPPTLDLAARNAPGLCVVSGTVEDVASFQKRLEEQDIEAKLLRTSHAFHSSMMEPVLTAFEDEVRRVQRNAPTLPWVSTVTGEFMEAETAKDPSYWAMQIRRPVNFEGAARTLFQTQARAAVELGPRHTLATLSRKQITDRKTQFAIPALCEGPRGVSFGDAATEVAEQETLGFLRCLGQLLCADIPMHLTPLLGQRPKLVLAPTYPFDEKEHLIAAPSFDASDQNREYATILAKDSRPVSTAEAPETTAGDPEQSDTQTMLGRVAASLERASGIELDLTEEADTSFVELGLDSLFLTQWARTLSEEFGTPVAFRQLLAELPTPGRLSEHLDAVCGPEQSATGPTAGANNGTTRAAPSDASSASTEVRFTPNASMSEIWLASQLDQGANTAFNLVARFEIRGALDPEALHEALMKLTLRHEALRTRFSPDGSEAVVSPEAKLSLEVRDLRGEGASHQANQVCDEHARTPFDLSKAPLHRAELLRLDEDRHELVWTFHHAIVDGWSFGVLFRELAALLSGNAHDLAPAGRLSAYCSAQKSDAASRAHAENLAYFKDVFDTVPKALDLPTDHPRPRTRTYHAARLDFEFSSELLPALRRTSAHCGATLFSTLLAAFQLHLFRLTNHGDFVVGLPSAQQPSLANPNLVGACVNTLPLRSQVDPDTPLGDFVARTHLAVHEAFEHGTITYTELLPLLPIEPDPSRDPLVPVYFNLEQGMRFDIGGGRECQFSNHPRAAEIFEFTFHVFIRGERFGVECTYNADLFTESTMRDRAEEYATILRSFAHGSSEASAEEVLRSPVAYVPVVPDAQRLAMEAFNATQRELDETRGVQHLIREQARLTPDRIGIKGQDFSLSYRDIEQRSNTICAELRSQGIGAGSLVGLCVSRSLHLVPAILGILKSGAAYLPLDPSQPEERLRVILSDASPAGLLLETQFASLTRSLAGAHELAKLTTVAVDTLDYDQGQEPGEDVAFDSQSLAYVIYTSGSTGRPKGVEITHRGFTNFLRAMQRNPGMTEKDVIIAIATVAFDITGVELLLPLMVGAATYLADETLRIDPKRLAALVMSEEVTMFQATPATYRMLLEAGLEFSETRFLCGGEAISRELRDELSTRCTQLYNVYGPTETTVWSTVGLLSKKVGNTVEIVDEAVFVGRPIDNMAMHLLDPRGRVVPLGAIGELCISGVGLGPGYLNRPELTESKYVDVGKTEINQRVYRSGDLARFHRRENGLRLECLGRVDFQVKIRGFRIELGEIETALLADAMVAEAVVHTVFEESDKQLCAYLKPEPGQQIDVEALRAELKQKLPVYMVPAYFQVLDAFPLTPNGKVDRKKLPLPSVATTGAAQNADDYNPKTPVEEVLMNVWKEILGVDRVSRTADFFELGGQSVQAVRMVQQVNLRGLALSPTALFQNTRLSDLASVVGTRAGEANSDPCLVTLREATGPTFYFMHSLPGDLLQYGPLVSALGSGIACYGFQALGLTDPSRAHPTLSAMAEHYIRVMLEKQPAGPFNLCGWCFGGNVALEMARRLRERGHVVGPVVLLETFPQRSKADRVLYQAHVLKQQGASAIPLLVRKAQRIFKQDPTLDPREVFALDADEGPFQNRRFVYERDLAALLAHRTTHYDGEVILVRASEQPKGALQAHDYGFGSFVRNLRVVEVPGAHQELLGKSYEAIAKVLRSIADELRPAQIDSPSLGEQKVGSQSSPM